MSTSDLNPPSKGEWRAISEYEPQYSLAAQIAIRIAREGTLKGVRLIDPDANVADDFQILTDQRIDAFQVKWEKLPTAFTFSQLLPLVSGLSQGRSQLIENDPGWRVVVHVVTNGPASTSDSIKDAAGNKIGSFFEFRQDILEPSRTATAPTDATLAKWRDALEELRAAAGLDGDEFDDFLRDLYVDVNATLASESVDVIGVPPPEADLSDVERVKAYLLRRVRESSGNAVIEITARELLIGSGLGDRLDLRNRHEFPKPDIDYRPIVACMATQSFGRVG